MTQLQALIQNFEVAHQYTRTILESVPSGDWFRMPNEGVSHIGWQVGHIAWAQQMLVTRRLVGEDPAVLEPFPETLIKTVGKGSTPEENPSLYGTPESLMDLHERVYMGCRTLIDRLEDSALSDPVSPPHPMFQDKAGVLRWAADHELTHTGQISLIRRLLGHAPLR